MIVYPAMDLIGGNAVRLQQGRFDDVTVYSTEPGESLRDFAAAGASWAHVVDLDGAKAGRPMQNDLIAELAWSTPLSLQVAGGSGRVSNSPACSMPAWRVSSSAAWR